MALAVALACGRHGDPVKAPAGGAPPTGDTTATGGSPTDPPASGDAVCGAAWDGIFQIGPASARGIALGPGCSVTIAGSTEGTIGAAAFGRSDPFLAEVDASGAPAWIVQFGSTVDEGAADVAVDAAGNRWVAWSIFGRLAGSNGAFASRFAPDGTETLRYTVPFTALSVTIALDAEGNAYLAGSRFTKNGAPSDVFAYDTDVFAVKIDGATGAEAWSIQLGTPSDDAPSGAAVDGSGFLVLAGTTGGDLAGNHGAGGTDGFVARIAQDGTLARLAQLGGPGDDTLAAVAVDGAGNTYVLGEGGLDANASVAPPGRFLAKLDGALVPAWSRQVDAASALAVGAAGDAWIAGSTSQALPGQTSAGSMDAFVARYDAAGNAGWVRQLGSAQDDSALGIVVDELGNSYVTGWTRGSLGAPSTGAAAAFVAKIDADGAVQ